MVVTSYLKSIVPALVLAVGFGAAAEAGSPQGTWRTAPDNKGQTAYVVSKPCGKGLCGTISKVMDPSGRVIAHPNTGQRVFWDMRPSKGGAYEGRAFVPAHNRDYAATMRVYGQEMQVRGCLGPVCQSQIWQRVK